MKKNEFRCAKCKRIFKKIWSDEDALKEKIRNFGDIPIEECVLICDGCYKGLMGMNKREGHYATGIFSTRKELEEKVIEMIQQKHSFNTTGRALGINSETARKIYRKWAGLDK